MSFFNLRKICYTQSQKIKRYKGQIEGENSQRENLFLVLI